MSKRIHIQIGSAPSNQVVIDHPAISPVHLELFADSEGNVFVTDLGSPQGTTINGKRLVGYALLSEGDDLVLGGKFRFHWEKYKVKASTTAPPPIKETSNTPPKQENRPKPSPPPIPTTPKNEKKKPVNPAKMEVSNKALILIFGAIFLILFLMYAIN
ncbi:MAG: FHA domain-containing protein [Flavobacteriia bacterium]|nr:FHA domain-containing protein [Flavobacteriia bacterium]